MKTKFFTFLFVLFAFLLSCESPVRSSYSLVFPELPGHWEEVLGKPCWRVEWINENGVWKEWEGELAPELSLNREWATPVLAWPFWPERGLLPGMMRPLGALFPWDVSKETLVLSWKGAVDAYFWKEMALSERPTDASEARLPWYFDWPRFRELFESDNIPEAVHNNPWLADWKSIAQRTVSSGFDRRRIVSKTFSELEIPGLSGRWIGSSPFTAFFNVSDEGFLQLMVAGEPDTWVSAGAVLKCSDSGWVYREQ